MTWWLRRYLFKEELPTAGRGEAPRPPSRIGLVGYEVGEPMRGGVLGAVVPAHVQKIVHSYAIAYPAHEPREEDPYKADFMEYKRRRKENGTYYCDFARDHRNGDSSECDLSKPLQCHHNVVELAMKNGVDLSLLEKDFPGVSQMGVGKWIDNDENLTMLCVWHHIGHAGVHVASYSDFTAEEYVRNLIARVA